MNNHQEKIAVSHYAHFRNVDDTILFLNPIIEKHGYKFIKENINKPVVLPRQLLNEIVHINDYRLPFSESIYILTEISTTNTIITRTNNITEIDNSAIFDTRKYIESLIQQLRLYKQGDIFCREVVTTDSEHKYITQKSNCIDGCINNTTCYSVELNEIHLLADTINKDFAINTALKLDIAINSFNTSYSIENLSIAYINLITCLESLLIKKNENSIQKNISNRILRLISIKNYSLNIDPTILYKLRSDIVHGRKLILPSLEQFNAIQNICRLALNHCIENNIDKQQLIITLS